MNAPPLIRPLRSVLQGRLQFASRSTPTLFRPSTQVRTNSSLIDNYDDYDAVLEGALKASAEKMAAAPEPEPTDVAAQVVQPAPKKAESSKKAEGSKKAKGSKISIGQHVPEGKLNPSYHGPRMPRSLELLYLEPLRREAEFGVPSCDLQLRSYSVPNLEFFCDFALRAAYYLKLPAYGPIPLPRLTKRWTVPRSVFVHKKSQENFERITLRRLIQIRDGNPESVQLWLAFLQKHAYFGVGMKANVWEFSGLDVAAKMDESAKELNEVLKDKWQLLGQHKSQKLDEKFKTLEAVQEFLAEQRVLAINGPGGRLD